MEHFRSYLFQLVPIFFGFSLRAIQEKKSFDYLQKMAGFSLFFKYIRKRAKETMKIIIKHGTFEVLFIPTCIHFFWLFFTCNSREEKL